MGHEASGVTSSFQILKELVLLYFFICSIAAYRRQQGMQLCSQGQVMGFRLFFLLEGSSTSKQWLLLFDTCNRPPDCFFFHCCSGKMSSNRAYFHLDVGSQMCMLPLPRRALCNKQNSDCKALWESSPVNFCETNPSRAVTIFRWVGYRFQYYNPMENKFHFWIDFFHICCTVLV